MGAGVFFFLFGLPGKNWFVSTGGGPFFLFILAPPPNAADALFGGNPKGRGTLGGFLRYSPSPYARYGFALAP
jgi:hypothetical protein